MFGYKICLDGDSVRQEAEERAEQGTLDPAEVDFLLGCSDDEIGNVISSTVDGGFWEAYDQLRSEVIQVLLSKREVA